MVSAAAYTAANICLRSVVHIDPVWVSCIKAVPTVLLVGPWLFVRMARGQHLISSLGVLGILVPAAILGQLVGNVMFQWSLGVVGIALSVPLNMGTMIISGALLGRYVLNESIGPRMVLAIVVLLAAIAILSMGAPAAGRTVVASIAEVPGMALLGGGVVAACLSGVAYSLLGVVVRQCILQGTPLSTILTTVCFVGAMTLGAASYLRQGAALWMMMDAQDASAMVLAGVFNALAFLALAKALELAGLVHVSTLNASQSAMAAGAGVVFFHESLNAALAVGVALTVTGLMLMQQPNAAAGHNPVGRISNPAEMDH
jgi:drug/metabolite transporter (DMT)-like permease